MAKHSNPGKYDRGKLRERQDEDPVYHAVLNAVMPQERAEEHEGVVLGRVYFALDAEASQVKIGMTGNLQRRLGELSAERGRELELLGCLAGNDRLERCLHDRFASYRREGREWYSAEILPDVLDLLTD